MALNVTIRPATRSGVPSITVCVRHVKLHCYHATMPETQTMPIRSALTVVQAQLDAYNAKDIDALLATYAPDAEQYTLHGERLAQGHAEMRPRFLGRFAEPDLHARLLSRTVMANVVVDLEVITRNFPEGRGTLEMLCVYEVVEGLIRKASFVLGDKKLDGL